MIQINTPYKLGTKTLWLSILGQGFPAIILFILLVVLSAISVISPVKVFENFHLTAAQYVSIDNFLSLGILLVISLFVLTLIYAVIFSILVYINYTFTLGDHALEINEGILSRSEMSIPYRQIQDVDVNQNIFQRIIGVCRLVVLTAGHDDKESLHQEEHSEGIFILIDRRLALQLHDELIKRSNVQEIQQFQEPLEKLSDGPDQDHI